MYFRALKSFVREAADIFVSMDTLNSNGTTKSKASGKDDEVDEI